MPPKKKPAKTDEREARFAAEYVLDFNGTEACSRAGYKGDRPTLSTQAYRLLRKAQVKRAIAALLEQADADSAVQKEEVLQVLVDHLRVDIGDCFDAKGQLLELGSMPPHVRRNIQSVEVEELFEGKGEERKSVGQLHRIKLWSKDKALELALRHKGLLNDKLNLKTDVPLEALIEAALNGGGKK